VSVAAWTLIGLVVLLGFWALGAYNRLVGLRHAIGQAWTQVQALLRQRGAAVAPLVVALREPLAAESASLDALLTAQARVDAAADALGARPTLAELAGAMARAEQAMTASSSRVLALLEHAPALREADEVAALLVTLNEAQAGLAFARQLFNDAAQRYDEAAAQFPTRLLTRMFGLAPAGRI